MQHFKYSLYILFIPMVVTLFGCEKILIGEEGTTEEDIYLNYQTITNLELPFEEEWHINNGGRTLKDGGHHFITWGIGQRYAFDAVIKINGQSYAGNGDKNEDYYCFGTPLYAPGSGVILEMSNDVEDNTPGELNADDAAGNYVLIDHLNGEYSVLAHFMKGSIVVSVGDTITQGQALGKTGNSGNSTEAHLHYHLQNSSEHFNSFGLPASFRNYFVNGEFVTRGEPTSGQFVKK